MIRITQQNSAGDAKRYYATADYYSQGQEIVGRWGGKGAALLGLSGTVDKFSFERLCDNLHPAGDPNRPITREWFNEGQKAAVRHVLGSGDRVMVIRGVAFPVRAERKDHGRS